MLFDRFDPAYVVLALAIVAIGLAHYWLARLHPWAGAIVPTVYVAFLLWLFITGRLGGVMDIVLLLLGLAALLSYWAKAREAATTSRT